MKATTERRTKRLADLEPGDVIEIDRGGHTAVVESNAPDSYAPFRARGLFQTRFLMDNGRFGGWTGNGESIIRLAPSSVGGAR